MAAPRKYDDERRAAMAEAVRDGESVCSVAKRFGCGATTVSVICKEYGVDPVHTATNKANEALRDYNLAERVKLINRFFEKAGQLLEKVDDTRELQSLATALAILIDKRRLEDGQVTARDERVTAGSSEQLASRIDSLAERLRSKSAA